MMEKDQQDKFQFHRYLSSNLLEPWQRRHFDAYMSLRCLPIIVREFCKNLLNERGNEGPKWLGAHTNSITFLHFLRRDKL
jgi:hypothetical protein